MGPLELQLYRELAIQMVRFCAEGQDRPLDLQTCRQWFDATIQQWAVTPREELDGQTPDQAIAGERRHTSAWSAPQTEALQYVELYTNLPEPASPTPATVDQAGISDLLASESPATVDPVRAGLDTEPANRRSADEETRWRAFCDRFLAGWLDA